MSRIAIAEKLLLDALFEIGKAFESRVHHVSIPKLIKLLRKRLRMPQRVLAKRAKIPVVTISRIESGKTKPSMRILEKIFRALFCDLAFLPIPIRDLDQIVKKRIHQLAEKRVRYLKGTMALELQQPKEEVMRELIAREEKALSSAEHIDIWQEEELHD